MRRVAIGVTAAIAFLLILGVTVAMAIRSHSSADMLSSHRQFIPVYQQYFDQCIANTLKSVSDSTPTFDLYNHVWMLCGNEVYNVDFLADFDIRREKFIQQELDERVILWMVVAITLSGVILAALQLLASYRIAIHRPSEQADAHNFAGPSEFTVEQGKLSLKSSVTGLMILVVSLIFFIVYVKWIYVIKEVGETKPDNLNGKISPILGVLGAAPPAKLVPPAPQTAQLPGGSPNPLAGPPPAALYGGAAAKPPNSPAIQAPRQHVGR